jgi:hypothetical protein
MKSKRSYNRLNRTEAAQQLKAVSSLRAKGLSVAQACKRLGVAMPTYYYRLKSAPKSLTAGLRMRTKPAILGASKGLGKGIDGRTLRALKRRKANQSALAEMIRKDVVELRKLGRRLLQSARALT